MRPTPLLLHKRGSDPDTPGCAPIWGGPPAASAPTHSSKTSSPPAPEAPTPKLTRLQSYPGEPHSSGGRPAATGHHPFGDPSPGGASAAPSPGSRPGHPTPGTYLLLDSAQQPLPRVRLCGTRRGDGGSAARWGRGHGPPSRRPRAPRPLTRLPAGPEAMAARAAFPSGRRRRRRSLARSLARSFGCSSRGGAGPRAR